MYVVSQVEPLHDNVLVKPEMEPEKVGVIIMPEQSRRERAEGVVIACGPGRRGVNGELIPMSVKVGDNVLFGKYSGAEQEIGGESYRMIQDTEIIAIIKAVPSEEVTV